MLPLPWGLIVAGPVNFVQGKSGTPVKFWRTTIELPRIRARADPQMKNGQRELVLPLTIPWSDE